MRARTEEEFREHFLSRFALTEKGCLEWQGSRRNGYGVIWYPVEKRLIGIHIVMMMVNGYPVPEGMVVAHKCDNRICGNFQHLYIGTQKQNVKDCWDRKRNSIPPRKVLKNGELVSPRAVLRRDDVVKIRELLKTDTIANIARLYGVGESTVRHIKQGTTWKE